MPPGPVTPAGIRAYALAMHCGVASKAEFEALAARFAPSKTGKSAKLDHELKALAAQFARDQLHAPVKTKAAMTRGLQRHWLSQRDEADDAHRSPQPWSALLRPAAAAHGEVQPPPLQAVGADGLLAAVRDAIPQIGADGRFGKENVFVAALWQRLAHDHRVPDLSLDRFKRWLVVANRDQLVDLARADLVDAMNPRLVEESEIEDLGATFHFVVDRQRMPAPGQVDHAR